MSKEERITFRTSAKTRAAIEQMMGDDGSRSMNEFIEHAVIRYIDQILMSKSTTLPKAISSAIDGRLGMLKDRLSALLFNNSVELDMLVQIIAHAYKFNDAAKPAVYGKFITFLRTHSHPGTAKAGAPKSPGPSFILRYLHTPETPPRSCT